MQFNNSLYSVNEVDGFCDTPFWDLDLTWHGPWPQFTSCFRSTILVWLPCGWLWLSAPFYLYYLTEQLTTASTWSVNRLLCIKLVCLCLLIFLSLVNACLVVISNQHQQNLITAEVFAPFFIFITLCFAAVVTVLERRVQLVTSAVQFIFWLLLSLSSLIILYTEVQLEVHKDDLTSFCLLIIQLFLYLFQFLLHCVADPPVDQGDGTKKPCPEICSSFPSRLSFWWMNPLMQQGYRSTLTEDDMPDLHPRDKSNNVVPRFMYHWTSALASWRPGKSKTKEWTVKFSGYTNPKMGSNLDSSCHQAGPEQVSLLSNGAALQSTYPHKQPPIKKKKVLGPSLTWILFRTFWKVFLLSQVWKVFADLLAMCNPLILGHLIDYVENSESATWNGYVLAVCLFVSTVCQTVLYHQVFHLSTSLGLRLRASLISAVYRKSLSMDNLARKESTIGEVVNLMSVDTERIESCIAYLWAVWSSPLQIILSLYLLYQYIGVSMFAGAAFLVLLIPCNIFITTKMGSFQTRLMQYKDARMKIINEVLTGIKIIKFYAWEKSFENNITEIREKELSTLLISAMISSVLTFSWIVAPFVVSLLTFLCFIYTSDNHHLDSKTAFVAISLFDILRYAINFAPMIFTDLLKAVISARRIGKFLCHKDLDKYVSHTEKADHVISIEGGNFQWSSDSGTTLKDIQMTIGQDQLVAVVGTVGSGKSSLISAILGDMERISGHVSVKGSMAYVPQQAWIQNDSLRNNILFGRPMDTDLYTKCVAACALNSDLDVLPAGDRTEIGERGINLSGGQKQRISLARALYAQADLYLLDDPLSAVDSHVGQHIFEKVIGHSGMLKGKVRVLVTHGIQYLAYTDHIIVMTNGQISSSGPYDELLSQNGTFARLISSFLEDDDEDDELDGNLQELKEEVLKRLSETEEEVEDTDKELITKVSSPSRQVSITSHLSHEKMEVIKVEQMGRLLMRQASQQSGLIDEEFVEMGSVRLAIYGKYFKSVGYIYVALIFALYALYSAANMGGLIILSAWTDDPDLANLTSWPANSSDRKDANDYYIGMYGFFGILQTVFIFSSSLIESLRAVHASRSLHARMLSRMLHAPMSFFNTTPIGRIINRFSKDMDDVDNEIPMTFLMFVDCMFVVVSTVVAISYSTPLFLAFLPPVAALYYFIQKYYISTSRQMKRLGSKTRSPIFNHFSESLAGASVIRAFRAENRFIEEADSRTDRNQIFMFTNYSCNRWLGSRLESLANTIILLAATIAVGTRDSISGGIMGLSITYALQVTESLSWLVTMASDLETQIVSVERITEYSEIKSEAAWENTRCPTPPGWPSHGKVKVEGLCVCYRKGLDLVLKNISFEVQPGEKIGIVGRTGAGKSSLTLALFRLVEPASGRILIDDVDISMLGLHDLRSKITILPQDPVIFAGTLRENLDPFKEHTDDALWQALDNAHLSEFVKGLPDQLGHECGEGGENLSMGQRQLLCLGRALLRKTKILVLDEATAAVDMETDKLIQETIRQKFVDCTILTIAHRLNTVMDYDRILVLDKGEVREFDSPQNLLRKTDGLFYSMAEAADLV